VFGFLSLSVINGCSALASAWHERYPALNG